MAKRNLLRQAERRRKPHAQSLFSPVAFGFCFFSVVASGECLRLYPVSAVSSSVMKIDSSGISSASDDDEIPTKIPNPVVWFLAGLLCVVSSIRLLVILLVWACRVVGASRYLIAGALRVVRFK